MDRGSLQLGRALRSLTLVASFVTALTATLLFGVVGTRAQQNGGTPPPAGTSTDTGTVDANSPPAATTAPVDAGPPGGEPVVPLRAAFRDTLSKYGTFVQHPKYTEVWVPTAVPQGWHPYPPCHWVNSRRDGWFFDDQTPWGAIVHHYGRWTHDDRAGWIWVPDDHFSPGWVVWRTSPQWVGWAPMPPDADIRVISAETFDNGGFWIFIETARFAAGCSDGVIAPVSRTPDLIKQTQYLTQLSYVDGIAVVRLPSSIAGTLVDIDITFDPWPAWFLVRVIGNWNWVWSNITVVIDIVKNCPPP